jgi:hypothetical protein
MTEPVPYQPNPTLRVSDAERARAASAVDAAVADGRLTWTEHSERSGQIWAAQTRAELAPPLADLGPVSLDLPQVQHVVAVFSKVGRATSAATQELHARAMFGTIVLDLTAMRPGQHITVNARSFCAKILIMVSDDATVVDEGEVFLAKRAALRTSPPPGGPVVRLTGRSSFGKLDVRRAADEPHGFGPVLGHLSQLPAGPGEQHIHLHQDRHLHVHGGGMPFYGNPRMSKQQLKKMYKQRAAWAHHDPYGQWGHHDPYGW